MPATTQNDDMEQEDCRRHQAVAENGSVVCGGDRHEKAAPADGPEPDVGPAAVPAKQRAKAQREVKAGDVMTALAAE